MNTQEKLNYMIKVYKSCRTNLQRRTINNWIKNIVKTMNLNDIEEQEFKHQLRISNPYQNENR